MAVTTIRTLAVHAIVQRAYPRPPPTERDQVAMAIGRAIDGTLAQFGHEHRIGRRPTATAMRAHAARLLDEGLEEAGAEMAPEERERTLTRVQSVLQAYRRSEIFGLARPKTRVILINGRVGVYAQPDYWNGRDRFFEMKSYPAIPPPPDVALQVRLFQLAFPTLTAVLICLNRHVDPVETTQATIPAPTQEEAAAALRLAEGVGLELGTPKVAEYVEGPMVAYNFPAAPP